LKGKVIVVTGGSGLYGKCLVEGLAEADGTVVTTSRDLISAEKTAEEFQARGLDVHPMKLDQGMQESVQVFKENLWNRFGRLDVFVNNAVSRPMKGYNAPISEFDESMKINATGMMDL